jgi:hypothetical protein
MNTVQNFVKEVKAFSRANWWVYIIYFVLLGIILLVEKEKLLSVFIITSLHFVADIFIMMMFSAYAHAANKQGTYYQVMSMLIFMSLKIYTGIVDQSWHYLAADPIYILAAVKNYRIDIKKSDWKIVNYKTMTILSLIIIFGILLPVRVFTDTNLLHSASQWVQTMGIFLFAIALSTTGNEHLRSELAIIALIGMVGGSAWETANLLFKGQIVGLALSYFLLPLTVLVYYVRNWSKQMHPKKTLRLN